jgi:hypothetical protein
MEELSGALSAECAGVDLRACGWSMARCMLPHNLYCEVRRAADGVEAVPNKCPNFGIVRQ